MDRRRMFALLGTVALTVVTGVLISQSSTATTAALPPDSPAAARGADAVALDSRSGSERWITPKPSNVSAPALTTGAKPPQFIIFSFDGAGNHDKLVDFEAAAAPTDSRFVGFLSGTYLLTDDHNTAYAAAGAKPGTSSIGFGGDLAEVTRRVLDLNDFYAAGHQIGTHYNGHFCALGANWSTADWNRELDQFFTWFGDWKTANGLAAGPDLRVPATAVTGGRTPCLAGRFDQLTPAWQAHQMTYDSSGENQYTGIGWPTQADGIWQFPIPTVYAPGFAAAGFPPLVKAMDYNFWYKFNKAKERPETAAELGALVLDTYRFMYDQTFAGNRAPILIANHFNEWNGDSFNPAARQFMTETCGLPDTICTTYADVIAWMTALDAAELAGLQALPPVAAAGPVTG